MPEEEICSDLVHIRERAWIFTLGCFTEKLPAVRVFHEKGDAVRLRVDIFLVNPHPDELWLAQMKWYHTEDADIKAHDGYVWPVDFVFPDPSEAREGFYSTIDRLIERCLRKARDKFVKNAEESVTESSDPEITESDYLTAEYMLNAHREKEAARREKARKEGRELPEEMRTHYYDEDGNVRVARD